MEMNDAEDIVTICIKKELLLPFFDVELDDLTQCFPCCAFIQNKGSEIVQIAVIDEAE